MARPQNACNKRLLRCPGPLRSWALRTGCRQGPPTSLGKSIPPPPAREDADHAEGPYRDIPLKQPTAQSERGLDAAPGVLPLIKYGGTSSVTTANATAAHGFKRIPGQKGGLACQRRKAERWRNAGMQQIKWIDRTASRRLLGPSVPPDAQSGGDASAHLKGSPPGNEERAAESVGRMPPTVVQLMPKSQQAQVHARPKPGQHGRARAKQTSGPNGHSWPPPTTPTQSTTCCDCRQGPLGALAPTH